MCVENRLGLPGSTLLRITLLITTHEPAKHNGSWGMKGLPGQYAPREHCNTGGACITSDNFAALTYLEVHGQLRVGIQIPQARLQLKVF